MKRFLVVAALAVVSNLARAQEVPISINDVDIPSTGTLTDGLLIFLADKSDSQVAINAYDRWIAPNRPEVPRELERLVRASSLTGSQKFNVYMAVLGVMTKTGNRGFGRMALHVTELRPLLRELARGLRAKTLTRARAELNAIEAEPVVE